MTRRTARTALVALTALLLAAPTAAQADDDDRDGRDGRGPGHHRDLPTTYLLDPVAEADPAIFPEGIAVQGKTFYVGSTTDGTIYRGRLDEPAATPFLLPGNPEGRRFAVGLEVDRGTLFVAGGPTGTVFAYDLRSRELVGQWTVTLPGTDPANPTTFLNDLAISRRGDVYVTDSLRDELYRIPADDRTTEGVEPLPTFVEFEDTELVYRAGFNLNGIVVSRDGRYLVVAQSNTGELFRIGVRDGSVVRIELEDGEKVAGDGLVLDGRTLYAVERQEVEGQEDVGYVVEIDLNRRLTEGEVGSRTTDPTFDDPTTAALVEDSLLVVNSQFGERSDGVDPDPFTVSQIEVP